MQKFFSHNPEDGWDLHDTLEEARTSAEGWLRADENNAGSDGWHPDVEDTCYGRIVPVGKVVETGRRPVDPDVDGEYMADHFKEVIQYEMREVSEEDPTLPPEHHEDLKRLAHHYTEAFARNPGAAQCAMTAGLQELYSTMEVIIYDAQTFKGKS